MVPLAGASPEFTHKEGKAIIQVASLFNQLLQHFPRMEFGALVKENNPERCATGLGCLTQLVSMLFGQLAHADSLREICNGLGCCLGKLVHLGITKAPNKSTLSYANEHRSHSCMRSCFIRRSSASAMKRGWALVSGNSASKTSCCHWIQPPSRSAWRCFHGPDSARPKAVSKPMCCWTTTITCRAMC